MSNIPVLIVLLPLSAALLCMALSLIHWRLGRDVVIASVAASLVLSVIQLKDVIDHGTVSYVFGKYKIPYGIEFRIDAISAVIIVMILIIGFITLLFSMSFEVRDGGKVKNSGAYTMLALLIVGMVGMTSTGDMFNLYVFLEITSLSGYCLIALGGSRGIVAAFRYMLVGTIAATFYLLGVGILYSQTGTLNMEDMHYMLSRGVSTEAQAVALVFIIAAFGVKMALFPFNGWQPSAYAHANAGSRPLIAGVMGKIPAYAMFRYIFCIYGSEFRFMDEFLLIVGIFSCCGIIYGSVRAMAQTDLRKMLAYSSVAQIGYITLGFATGSPVGIVGGFLHMLAHAFMKSGLFFGTGAIRQKYGSMKMEDLGYIYKKMPLTSGLVVVAALSMVGIPPLGGFFSKWYIGMGAAGSHHLVYLFVLVISSLLNAVYFFKLFEKMFMARDKELPDRIPSEVAQEVPWNMVLAIVVCFLAIILIGVFNVPIVNVLMPTVMEVGS